MLDFLVHLGPPTLVAVGVGWWAYRRTFALPVHSGVPTAEPDRAALVTGGVVVVFLVVGFSVGSRLGF